MKFCDFKDIVNDSLMRMLFQLQSIGFPFSGEQVILSIMIDMQTVCVAKFQAGLGECAMESTWRDSYHTWLHIRLRRASVCHIKFMMEGDGLDRKSVV